MPTKRSERPYAPTRPTLRWRLPPIQATGAIRFNTSANLALTKSEGLDIIASLEEAIDTATATGDFDEAERLASTRDLIRTHFTA